MGAKIAVEYDGEYPNLCGGTLKVTINRKKFKFPPFCLSSGGCVNFSPDWDAEVGEGPWTITDWPKNFPNELKDLVIDVVNQEIPHGCCGGCV